jgi:hypothetical protein
VKIDRFAEDRSGSPRRCGRFVHLNQKARKWKWKSKKCVLCPCCVSRPQMVKSVQAITKDITKARADFPKSSQLFDAVPRTKVGIEGTPSY